ncbi:MAG: acetate kinase [Bacteroidales bacterium]|jgi:acetate kinase|nr:acetate kinase [Bacteroidales bacterium]
MNILVLNCGSSSIKYQLLDMSGEPELKAKGLVERIGLEKGILTHKTQSGLKFEIEQAIPEHTVGIKLVLAALTDEKHGVIKSLNEIKAVGHRVVHGAEDFCESIVINSEVIKKIEECCNIAPLHNPANLLGINAILAVLPNVHQVAVFDTAFHQTMLPKAFIYPVPYETYKKYQFRRYGFHGTSHKFVAEKACNILGWDIKSKKIITCHLGNGASICAIENGKSVDTSMGFTPVEGLEMGTRVGDIDPGALLFLMEKENMDLKQANNYINKKSGMLGVSEGISDMRDIMKAADEGNNNAKLAFDIFIYRVKKYIGSYIAAMNGVDLIIMTGGIGENAFRVRKEVFQNMEFLGIDFDEKANDQLFGQDKIISTDYSKIKVMTITTDEELVIATDTLHLIS